jgi:hypothetical protein
MGDQVRILGWLFIAVSILGIVTAAIVFVAVAGGGLISGDAEAIRITSIVATAVASFMALLALPGIVVGAGLLRFRPWARVLAVVLAILSLPNFPIGTALGIYALVVLLSNEGARTFSNA